MSRSSEPITITLPEDWTPEQAWAVHEILGDLLEHAVHAQPSRSGISRRPL